MIRFLLFGISFTVWSIFYTKANTLIDFFSTLHVLCLVYHSLHCVVTFYTKANTLIDFILRYMCCVEYWYKTCISAHASLRHI